MFQSPIISHQLIGMISPRHFAALRSPRLAERLAANGFWGPLELLQERLAVGRKMTPGWGSGGFMDTYGIQLNVYYMLA